MITLQPAADPVVAPAQLLPDDQAEAAQQLQVTVLDRGAHLLDTPPHRVPRLRERLPVDVVDPVLHISLRPAR